MAQCMQQTAALAHRIVRDHGGCTLYAGGDDVMAALPVQSALACAQALQRELTSLLQQSLPADLAPRTTLSVGIAMAHVLTPMGQVRRLAQRALQWAKTGPDGAQAQSSLRDALCVWVEPRGGLGRPCVGRWRGVGEQSMVERLRHWQSAFKGGDVARSLPYDLMTEVTGEQDWAIPAAIHRLLTRRFHGDEAASKRLAADVQALIEFWKGYAPRSGQIQWICERLADELYVSRWLQAQPQPQPQPLSSTLSEPSGAVHA
jgi:CRISPR-associated protein Cmr2